MDGPLTLLGKDDGFGPPGGWTPSTSWCGASGSRGRPGLRRSEVGGLRERCSESESDGVNMLCQYSIQYCSTEYWHGKNVLDFPLHLSQDRSGAMFAFSWCMVGSDSHNIMMTAAWNLHR